ncbi:MAG: hypothetical protein AAGA90_23565 [Actinomycetota bacterium]
MQTPELLDVVSKAMRPGTSHREPSGSNILAAFPIFGDGHQGLVVAVDREVGTGRFTTVEVPCQPGNDDPDCWKIDEHGYLDAKSAVETALDKAGWNGLQHVATTRPLMIGDRIDGQGVVLGIERAPDEQPWPSRNPADEWIVEYGASEGVVHRVAYVRLPEVQVR